MRSMEADHPENIEVAGPEESIYGESKSSWTAEDLTEDVAQQESALDFLHAYTGIAQDSAGRSELRRRVAALQEASAASGAFQFGCCASARFVKPFIHLYRGYPAFLARAKQSQPGEVRALEIGSCFCTDTRKLLHDGVPAEGLTATDLTEEYIKHSKILFDDDPCDRGVTFFAADLALDFAGSSPRLQSSSELMARLERTQDLIVATAVLHTLSLPGGRNLLARAYAFLRDGGQFWGMTVGAPTAGPWFEGGSGGRGSDRYLHSRESLATLLKQVGFAKVHVTIEAYRKGVSLPGQATEETVRLAWECTR